MKDCGTKRLFQHTVTCIVGATQRYTISCLRQRGDQMSARVGGSTGTSSLVRSGSEFSSIHGVMDWQDLDRQRIIMIAASNDVVSMCSQYSQLRVITRTRCKSLESTAVDSYIGLRCHMCINRWDSIGSMCYRNVLSAFLANLAGYFIFSHSSFMTARHTYSRSMDPPSLL